ncbi:MAG: VOC family protein [Chloroflexi bacterium]|nr:VOC family protein [Chloroflexota bacterium]
MGSRFTELIVDASNPDRLALFWMAVLGWQPTGRYPAPAVEIADPARQESLIGPTITFVPVPDEKQGKNRLHIDVNPVGCDQDAEVERLLGLGARRVDVGQGAEKSWVVLADPEGNEFCVLRDRMD